MAGENGSPVSTTRGQDFIKIVDVTRDRERHVTAAALERLEDAERGCELSSDRRHVARRPRPAVQKGDEWARGSVGSDLDGASGSHDDQRLDTTPNVIAIRDQ
jgi:hypothetical protein